VVWLNRFLMRYRLARHVLVAEKAGENPLMGLRSTARAGTAGGPLVSVLMPVRNGALTLSSAIGSLLNQTYGDVEILACDDFSDDDSLGILNELRLRDQRLRVFRSHRQQGAYNVRRALLAEARGELVTFHDADDIALPERICRQVSTLKSSGAVACVASLLRFTPTGAFVFSKDQRATRLCLASMMLRTETLRREHVLRPARVGADWELYADLCAKGAEAVVRVEAPLVWALSAPGSATRSIGTEAELDGYRAPARRAYCELVYAKHARKPRPTDFEIEARLHAFDNYLEPAGISEA
jgi:hypothetical protein